MRKACDHLTLKFAPKNIYLVACSSGKHLAPSKARHLYSSTLFEKASKLADRRADEWFILSAKHGLLHPDQIIEPYDLSLKSLTMAGRRIWADQVLSELLPTFSGSECVVLLAGKLYRENLVAPIREHGFDVEIPMEGLRIGEQLSWLNQQLGES